MDCEAQLFIFLTLILTTLSGSEATVFCYNRYCSNQCCGDIYYSYCCNTNLISIGEIVGIVFGCGVVVVIIIIVVCVLKSPKRSGGRVLPQTTVIQNTGQPNMQYNPQYPPRYNAQPQGQNPPAYPPSAAMYNHPPQGNPSPPGFKASSQGNINGAPQGQPNQGNPPTLGFNFNPQGTGDLQGQQPNPFAQAAQKNS